ncbi:hypothetical protein DFH09DRAFT_1371660, partial [Mycena vulgaris]
MNLITTFLMSLVAVAVANPIVDKDISARDLAVNSLNARCNIVPFLECSGGASQEAQCESVGFQCPLSGKAPVTSDNACADAEPGMSGAQIILV